MSVSKIPALKPILAKESERFAVVPRQQGSFLATEWTSRPPDSKLSSPGVMWITAEQLQVGNVGKKDETNRQWYSSQHHPSHSRQQAPSLHPLSSSSSVPGASGAASPTSEDPYLCQNVSAIAGQERWNGERRGLTSGFSCRRIRDEMNSRLRVTRIVAETRLRFMAVSMARDDEAGSLWKLSKQMNSLSYISSIHHSTIDGTSHHLVSVPARSLG